jgi:hypothetical protein
VRRDVGRHADGDAGRSVDEQVRERRRKHRRLFGRLVVIRDEVDGLFVEIRHQRFSGWLGPGLRIPHRRRRIAVDGTVVPLAVDQGVSHVEVLREPDERVVCGRIAMRMELADDFADDRGALAVRTVGREAHVSHRVEHTPVRRLQPVPDIRQGAPDDYAHRVIHVRALHFVFDVDGDFRGCEVGHRCLY